MTAQNTCTAVIVAAGSASRMGGIDKLFAPIGGIPVLLRTVQALSASAQISEIVIVAREGVLSKVRELCAAEKKLKCVVSGGETRVHSVRNGLCAVETPLVAIHDGARPLVTAAVIDAAVAAAELHGAAAPAIAVHDTIKIAQAGVVLSTPDRATLFAVQTPQVFATEKIRAAIDTALALGIALTDDCSAAEAAGMTVQLTAGDRENLKITTPLDLDLAETILKRRAAPCESDTAMMSTASVPTEG